MKPHITIVTLGVEDLQRAIEFYHGGLGFPLMDEGDTDSIAFFKLEGIILGLYPIDKLAEDITISSEGSGFQGFTLAHNVGSPEEVDNTLAEAVSAGAEACKTGPESVLGRVFWLLQRP